MRQAFKPKLQSGEVRIPDIDFDLDSRDDIPHVLRGLQQLYANPELRDEALKLLDECLPKNVDRDTGRTGMDFWTILVLGVLRLALNCDYDRLAELANEHRTVRLMLGHLLTDLENRYGRTTIIENVSMITPEALEKISALIVKCGHDLLGQTGTVLLGRCDSVVVETDVEFPTDARILLDAMRRLLKACQRAKAAGISTWRQYWYQYQTLRNLYLRALKLRKSQAKDQARVDARKQEIRAAYQAFLARARGLVARIEAALEALLLLEKNPLAVELCEEIERFLPHAHRQIDQIHRRVILDETIPHEEKVFSVFEEYTEWVSKGKAGVLVELGVRVAIVEDQFQFILHHRVMAGETDEQVPVKIVQNTQAIFPDFRACSFDKGFSSAANRGDLEKLLDLVVLPKKGKWSEKDRERETAEDFVAMRRQHSAVESAINALEIHGLDRCCDHGLDGFKRYVAWAVVGRNLLRLGSIAIELDREQRRRTECVRQRREDLTRQRCAA